MFTSPLLSRNYWPLKEFPENVYAYYVSHKFRAKPTQSLKLRTRENIIEALETDEEFRQYWNAFQRQYPGNEKHVSATNYVENEIDACWVETEYAKHQQRVAFEALSDEEHKILESEFNALRPKAYQQALKGEALRLGCKEDEVRPLSLVHPLTAHCGVESKLTALEDEILLKVMKHLDVVDIFRLTQVCKRWRGLVYNYPEELTRAEHAITTHLITFTDWMDPKRHISRIAFQSAYQSFSWNLVKWYCGISHNVERLVLDRVVLHLDLVLLLQTCPKLKSLVIDSNVHSDFFTEEEPMPPDVQLPKLEVFCSCPWYDDCIGKLNRDVLASSQNLKAFRGPLTRDDWRHVDVKRPIGDVFRNLIALDFTDFSVEVLEMLVGVGALKLKYLRLGRFVDYGTSFGQCASLVRSRDLFHQLLPSIPQLEVLIVLGFPGVNNATIKLLTELEVGLSFAILCESHNSRSNDETVEADTLKSETLVAFQNMLLSRNLDLDLSQLSVIVNRIESWSNLQNACTEVDVRRVNDVDHFVEQEFVGLNSPTMKRRMCIDL